MQKRFIWARQLKKSLLKKVNPTTLPPLPVTPVQLQGAPRSISHILVGSVRNCTPNASYLWLSVCLVSPVNEDHLRKRLSMHELTAQNGFRFRHTRLHGLPARSNNGIGRINYNVRQRVRFASTFIDGNSAPCSSQQGKTAGGRYLVYIKRNRHYGYIF